MININALIKLIDKNQDNIMQKAEIQEFLKTQDKSIFTNYADTINKDINSDEFETGFKTAKNNNKDENLPELNFMDKQAEKQYNDLDMEDMQYKEMYFCHGYKFQSDEEFNKEFQKYIELLKKENYDYTPNVQKYLSEFFEERKVPAEIMFSRLNTGNFPRVSTLFQFTNIDKNCDLSKYPDAFKYITFNEKTFENLSSEKLPKGYKPKEVFEKGKSIGLGIDDVHKMGYTGKGMSIAVIDSGTRCTNGKQHNALKFKEYHVPTAEKTPDGKENPCLNYFHGLATSYIAQQIAPDADLYYYAQTNEINDDTLAQNLQAIIDKNKTLPADKKIRIVSLSLPIEGNMNKSLEKAKELEAQGVWIFSSNNKEKMNNKSLFTKFWDKFGYLEKKDAMGDINEFNNYQAFNYDHNNDINELLFVNSGDRTVPDPDNPDAFRHDSTSSASWAIPVVAGYYTLACQADSTMTPDKFTELAHKTARTVKSTLPVMNSNGFNNRTKETKDIKIIDIKALLQEIEKGKNI